MPAAGPFEGLLQGVGGEDAEAHRDAGVELDPLAAGRRLPSDVDVVVVPPRMTAPRQTAAS